MSRMLPGVFRTSTFWIFTCGIGIPFYALSRCSQSRLDEPSDDAKSTAFAHAQANSARRNEILKVAEEFTTFADNGPSVLKTASPVLPETDQLSVYHVVDTIKNHIEAKDFVEIYEKDDWTGRIQPGGKYFVRRAGSSGNSIIAFAVGKKWQPGEPFSIVASHVDSPCLKLKPVSNRTTAGFRQLGVETYGGGLWHTWFDRDLGVAGRVFVRTTPTTIESRLVQIDEPILRIPCIALHYEHQNPFKFDLEQHLHPITSQQSQEISSADRKTNPIFEKAQVIAANRYTMTSADGRHPRQIVDKIADKLDVHPDNIVDFDLSLYDVQKAALGGNNKEFIFSARIDNLMMTFCAMKGFLASLGPAEALDDERCVRTFVAFDHEEIGSTGSMSAQSTFLPSIIGRIAGSKEAHARSIARSLLISADVIHAQHPNYHNYHDVNHKPVLNGGIVFSSTSRRYLAKSTPSVITILEAICKLPLRDDRTVRADIDTSAPPVSQFFVMPNGRDCGSTIGPHLEAKLGMRVVDMGNSTLSMHSIREMAGSMDVDNAVRFLRLFYENYADFENWVVVS